MDAVVDAPEVTEVEYLSACGTDGMCSGVGFRSGVSAVTGVTEEIRPGFHFVLDVSI